jgi:DNA invertase Pin-like site-specific DNA recombinase
MNLVSTDPRVTATRRAAQYVRMSTDMQKYSTDNQEAIIALYASTHGLNIVRTYADEGKSGLKIKGRAGLRQLIEDVRSGDADFDTILVYDVSRWGRFQDADESAYYEFVCRDAGISVRYCAEEFENDGSLAATILKTMKRAMAGEYSRELSAKVFIGKCNIVRKGFRHGGRAGYGLRRMVVDEHGARKGSLEDGQQKFLHTDRIILVPGPSKEVQTVRWIFDRFTLDKATLIEITRDLNAREIKNGIGNAWVSHAVRGLLSNEKYIGNNIFNQTSVKLKGKCVRNPPDRWIRADGAFEAIVDKETFELARVRLATINRGYADFQLLDHLTALWCRHGHLSTEILQTSPGCPSTSTFTKHFGSMLEAFKRVGYPKLTRRPVYVAWRKSVSDNIIAQVQAWGGTARHVGLRRQTRLLINDEVIVTVALAHWCYRTRKGKPRWILKHSANHHSDLVVLARFDEKSEKISDYLLLPGVALDNPQQLIMDSNHLEIDSFRSESLSSLAALFARQSLASGLTSRRPCPVLAPVHRAPTIKLPALQAPRSSVRNAAAKILLKSFERQSKRMVSFIEKCHSIAERQRKLENTLQFLFSDRSFCKILFDENLDALPAIVAKRMSQ